MRVRQLLVLLGTVCTFVHAQDSSRGDGFAYSRPAIVAERERSAVAWLPQPVVSAEFANTPLRAVVDWLSDLTGQPVIVRWSALADAGIHRDTPVTVAASGQPLWKVLWTVSNAIAAPRGDRLAFEASQDGFLFSTHSELSRNFVTAAYDVEAWLQPEADFIPKQGGGLNLLPWNFVDLSDPRAFWPRQAQQEKSTASRRNRWDDLGRENGRIPPGAKQMSDGNYEVQHHTEVTRVRATAQPGTSLPRTQPVEPLGAKAGVDPAMRDLVELILNTIEPDSWEINGTGGRATLAPFRNKQIIVRNSVYVHQLIGGYLQDKQSLNGEAARVGRQVTSLPMQQAATATEPATQPTAKKATLAAGRAAENAAPPPKRGDAVGWLDAIVDDAKFDEVPLEQVLDWVGRKSGAMIVIRWSTLEDFGVRRDMPITVDARGRKLWRLLWAVSNQIKDKAGDALAFEAAGDAFLFSSHGDLTKEMVTKIYKVADWLQEEADFEVQYDESRGEFVPVERRMHTKVKRLKPIIVPSTSGVPSVQPASPITEISHPHEDLMDLLELILNSVEPDSWEFNGQGGRGTIFPYKRDKLIVRNSLYVHQLVGGFLSDRDAVRELKRSAAKAAAAKK